MFLNEQLQETGGGQGCSGTTPVPVLPAEVRDLWNNLSACTRFDSVVILQASATQLQAAELDTEYSTQPFVAEGTGPSGLVVGRYHHVTPLVTEPHIHVPNEVSVSDHNDIPLPFT